jgi:DNA gyrase inhibitor GyrI
MSMNMMIVIVVIGVIAGDMAGLYYFARRFGAFAPVKPETKTIEPMWIAYNTHVGPYQLIGPVCDGVCRAWSEASGVDADLGFGLYYDNPRKVAKDQLRSLGGCIIPAEKAQGLADRTLPFRIASLPGGRAVVVHFPFRGRMSIMVGAMRVYPKMGRHITEAGLPDGPMMEIYDMKAGEIRYVRPLFIPNEELERLL